MNLFVVPWPPFKRLVHQLRADNFNLKKIDANNKNNTNTPWLFRSNIFIKLKKRRGNKKAFFQRG